MPTTTRIQQKEWIKTTPINGYIQTVTTKDGRAISIMIRINEIQKAVHMTATLWEQYLSENDREPLRALWHYKRDLLKVAKGAQEWLPTRGK